MRLTQERVEGIRESSWRAIEKKREIREGRGRELMEGERRHRVSTEKGPREMKACQFLSIRSIKLCVMDLR